MFPLKCVVCRGDALSLGVWMFIRDNIDGSTSVLSQAGMSRRDAATSQGQIQQALERGTQLTPWGRFSRHLLQSRWLTGSGANSTNCLRDVYTANLQTATNYQ